MRNTQRELKQAFIYTIPILCGYLVLGIAFGVLLQDKGYNFLWALFMSIIIYSGSAQFIAVGFLASGLDLLSVAVVTLLISVRHIFYGLSMIEKFENFGLKKLYMIFALTDETYSVLCATRLPGSLNKNNFMFYVAALNHLYWICGSVIGAVLGGLFKFNTAGIDFTMTALFVVIFVDQWKSYKNHIPALTGLICTAICLILFGKENFILYSMVFIVFVLYLMRKPLEKSIDNTKEKEYD